MTQRASLSILALAAAVAALAYIATHWHPDEKWLGLLGVLLGAFIVGGKDFYFDWRRQSSNAQYMAIRAICLLDRFVDGCCTVVGDDGTVMGQPARQDGTSEAQADYPPFPIDSLDGDWKAMPQALMYDLLSFSNRIHESQGYIGARGEISDPPDYGEFFEARQFEYARLGLRAHDLAEKLRKQYGLSLREPMNWDPVQYLRQQMAELIARREAQKSALIASDL